MAECCLCGRSDTQIIWVLNQPFCIECEEFERTVDLDRHEQKRRERIAEEQEY